MLEERMKTIRRIRPVPTEFGRCLCGSTLRLQVDEGLSCPNGCDVKCVVLPQKRSETRAVVEIVRRPARQVK